MNEENTNRTEQAVSSGCPSPARVEKTDSSSSRQSGSPIHWDFESWIVSDSLSRSGRIRPSSWDDSDDDLSPKLDTSTATAGRIYSSESKEVKGSVSFEINELKKQFFESLEREKATNHESLMLEDLREKLEIRLKCDRRQSPARVRRRSRSSSSSSPILDTKCQNSPEAREKPGAPGIEPDDSDHPSPKALEQDAKFYLNNFFSELRSKRISMHDSLPVGDKIIKDGIQICDNLKLEMLNDLNTLEVNEDGGYFCRTSRKLSQILEVEENKKDPERSSEENTGKSETSNRDSDKSENDLRSPLLTSRSKVGEKVLQNLQNAAKTEKEGFKSWSYEKLGSFDKVEVLSRGNLSERSARVFNYKLDDDFIHLCAKSGKTQLNSPKTSDNQNAEKPFQFLCLTDPFGENPEFSAEPPAEKEDNDTDCNTLEALKTELSRTMACESPTAGRNTHRSQHSHSGRTKSGKSKRSSNPQSPRLGLNDEADSARSLPKSNSSKSKSSTPLERQIPSAEECSPRKSSKSSCRSEGTGECKTERNLHIQLESPSLDSVKSSSRSSREQSMASANSKSGRSIQSFQKSQRERTIAAEQILSEQNAFENTKSPVASSRSPDRVSNRSSKIAEPFETPAQCYSEELLGRETPRSEKNFFHLEITERPDCLKTSSRSTKAAESEMASEVVDQFQPNIPSRRLSERSSRRSVRSRKSTERSIKKQITPKNSGSDAITFENGGELQETPRVPILQELCSVLDAVSNCTPVASSRRRSSWREIDYASRQPSFRSEASDQELDISGVRRTYTPEVVEATEERIFSSRRSSARSAGSCDKMTAASSGNVSPCKSEKNKSRPSSWSTNCVPPEVERIDIEALSGRSTIFEEDEEKEEINSKSETESDRTSNKRLSVINEVSLEDFETVINIEPDEKHFWDRSRPPSRVESKQVSPKSAGSGRTVKPPSRDSSKTTARSFKENSDDSVFLKQIVPDRSTWSELIETFEGDKNSSHFSKKSFPGFPSRREENSIRLSICSLMNDHSDNLYEEDVEDIENPFRCPKKSINSGSQTPQSERKEHQEKEDFDFSLVSETLAEKIKSKDERAIQSPQNLFYVEVDKREAFAIGEFGDISCWSAGKSDPRDLNKPQDHGDGMYAFKSSEVLAIKPEKKEKETKTQRQLWTELREDFRDVQPFPSELFPSVETGSGPCRFFPIGLKISKSENCIYRNMSEGMECYSSGTCEFLREYKKQENAQELPENNSGGDRVSARKDPQESFSSESTDVSKEEEFDCERTPRLSRSLSDLDTQLKMEKLNESSNSKTQLFESTESSKEKKESFNLNIFLARKREEEMAVKSNNWLTLDSQGNKKSNKRNKRSKVREKKSSTSQREPYVQYLTSSKSRSAIPSLKLRHSNCFQNFYKRVISVFCVTSSSSAATSK